MFKLIAGLSRVLLIAALASGFTLYFTWTIVSTYVDKLIQQLNLPVEGQLVGLSDLVDAVADDLGQLGDRPDNGSDDSSSSTSAGDQESSSSPPKDATPVFGQEIEEQDAEKELVFSYDELAEKRDQISQQDRQEIFKYLTSLSAGEMSQISELMEGGITDEDMQAIIDIVKQSIAEEDFQKLMDILEKY